MRVHVAEPVRLPGDRVDQDRRLAWRPGLEHLHVIVPPLAPLQIHGEVDLGIDGGARQSLHRPHDSRLQEVGQVVHPPEEGELHHRVPDVAFVQFLDELRLEIPEDLPAVRDEELAPLLGCLEADEGRRPGSPRAHELVVHPNEKVLPALLVHGLVHRRVLVAVHGRSGRDRMEGIQAGVHPDRLVELHEAGLLLHEVELPKDDGAVLDHLPLNFHGVFPHVGELSLDVVRGEADVGRSDGGRKFHLP
mmetsp:Transcript_33924/g.72322  ORF Transcript_33924/g.72322 Transcript_33924/m.72322 type:complete len:248 (-) Transcript_33924:51-794(-)